MTAHRTDVFDEATRSAVMRRVKGRDTGPELKVRQALTRLGARYRLHRKDLPGKPDIVLPGRRIAIFVHGCFWHGHDCARGARVPKQNRDYWVAKIARNRARDQRTRAELTRLGWRLETIWECELNDAVGLERTLRILLSAPTADGPAVKACALVPRHRETPMNSTNEAPRGDAAGGAASDTASKFMKLGWVTRWRMRNSARRLASKLLPYLHSAWGASDTYSVPQIQRALREVGFSGPYVWLAYAAFLSPADFRDLYPRSDPQIDFELGRRLFRDSLPDHLVGTYAYEPMTNEEAARTYGPGAVL